MMKYGRTYEGIPNDLAKLKYIVREHTIATAPSLLNLRPPPPKKTCRTKKADSSDESSDDSSDDSERKRSQGLNQWKCDLEFNYKFTAYNVTCVYRYNINIYPQF